jgi:phosphatidylserine/phosphatidylglycerophosphate/cardiolipin synthase-like enzyme
VNGADVSTSATNTGARNEEEITNVSSCRPHARQPAGSNGDGAACPAWCVRLRPRDGVLYAWGELYDVIVQALGSAKHSILAQAYSFTSAPIAKALLDAHKRGIQVQVILDKSQRSEKYSSADFLANQGVPTLIDATHAIAHNKVMVIDGETVLTGSFNFTKAAQEKNAENLQIIRDPALAAQYTQNWDAHRQYSQPYVGRGVR